MALFSIDNVRLAGISACVPKNIVDNKSYPHQSPEDNLKFIASTGIAFRRKADPDVCTSDLCYEAADKLIKELGWKRDEIDVLVFVTQTPDFILPITATILQDRLQLSTECLAFDIPLGCSGYVYGISSIASMLSAGKLRKGLLLVGDTITKKTNQRDKSTEPLFGDAGTASAFEFDSNAKPIEFHLNSDGVGYKTICIPDGGNRNPVNSSSFEEQELEGGLIRRNVDLFLDGMDVFSFGIDKAPATTKHLLQHLSKTVDDIDYFIFHQANRFMNEKIRKKLGVPEEKYLYSLQDYGNTSSATIPLTLLSQVREIASTNKLNLLLCGFGVGLSWGSVYIETNNLVCPKIIEI